MEMENVCLRSEENSTYNGQQNKTKKTEFSLIPSCERHSNTSSGTDVLIVSESDQLMHNSKNGEFEPKVENNSNDQNGFFNQNSGSNEVAPSASDNYLLSIKQRCKKKVGRRDKPLIAESTKSQENGCSSTSEKMDDVLNLNEKLSVNAVVDDDNESILKDYLRFLYGDEAISLNHNEYDTSFLKIEDSSNTSSSSTSEVFRHRSYRNKSIENKYEYRKDGEEGKPFICGICSKAFGQHSNIVLHMRSHTGEKPYVCDVCSKGFSGKSDLNRHKNIHSVIKKYWCDECKRGFNDNSGFRRHKLIYHSASSKKCTICPKSYLAQKDLDRHMKTHNKQEKRSNDNVKQNQNDSCHSDDGFQIDQEEILESEPEGDISQSPNLEATNMSIESENSPEMEELLGNFEDRPHKCGQCNFACSKRSNLRKHIAYVHCIERYHKCDICLKAFKSSWALKRHRQVHSEEKMFQCDLCDKGFNDTGSYKYHMKSHRGEKSHQCEICAKSFILKSDLKKHMSSHIKKLQQAAEQELDNNMEVLIQSDESFLDLASYI